MSAFLGGRSGNRGSCAGPCRLPFDASHVPLGKPGVQKHLSLKDEDALAWLPRLAAAGVCSAKIEGRLRDPEYVAVTVASARAARAGLAFDQKLLQDVFSRSGFTNGYLEGKIGPAMFGVRTEADSAASKAAEPAARELYRREYAGVPVDFTVAFDPEGVKLTATDRAGNRAIAYSRSEPQPAQKDPREGLERALGKTGGTPFRLAALDLTGEPGFLPGSEWNEMRRTVLEGLLKKRSVPRPLPVKAVSLPHFAPVPVPPESQKMVGRFERWEQIPEGAANELTALILPLGQAAKVPPQWRKKTLLELPRAMFGTGEQDTARRVEETKNAGFAGYAANNLAHFALCKGLPVYGGLGLNVTNPLAALEYKKLGAKGLLVLPEVTVEEMAAIGAGEDGAPGLPTAALIYGHLPLMLTRACPLQNVTDCAHCRKEGVLTDRKGYQFQVRCGLGVRTIYNPVPLYLGDAPTLLPVRGLVAYFTLESTEEAAAVLEKLRRRSLFGGAFTRGLYQKGTQ